MDDLAERSLKTEREAMEIDIFAGAYEDVERAAAGNRHREPAEGEARTATGNAAKRSVKLIGSPRLKVTLASASASGDELRARTTTNTTLTLPAASARMIRAVSVF